MSAGPPARSAGDCRAGGVLWYKPRRMPCSGSLLSPGTAAARRGALLALGLAALLAGCAGSTAKGDPADHALGQVPGRWENKFVEVWTPTGPMKFHYVAAGPKDAPRVILLHGFPDFTYTWREVAPLLSGDHRVIAPDMRGYGATSKPRKGYDLDTLAADILAFADATAAADAAPAEVATHLIGHDWGAAVGWWTVLKSPKRFTSYTAISVAHPQAFTEFLERSEEQRRRSKYMRKLTIPGVPLFFAGMKGKKRRATYSDELTRKEAFGDNELIWYRAAFDSTYETRPPIRYYKEKFRRGQENEAFAKGADKIGIPVLVLWGKKDSYLMSEMAADSCKFVAAGQCRVHVFPEVGHWVHWDDPKGVAQQWRAFVAGEKVETAAPAAAAEAPAPA